MSSDQPVRRLKWTLVAGTSALILLVVLLQSISQLQAVAQPVVEVTEPNLSVEKRVSAVQAGPGDVLTYSIQIANPGVEITVWMTDELPSEVTYVDDSLQYFGPEASAPGFSDGVITWSHSPFGYGHTALITFSAQISPDVSFADIVNMVQVAGNGELLTDSIETQVRPGHLDVSKAVFPTVAHPGENLVYTVHITNSGGTSLDTVWLTDHLPSEVSYVTNTVTATRGSFGEAGGVITWNATTEPGAMVPFPPAGEAILTFTVEALAGGGGSDRFTNTAQVTGTGSLLLAHAPVEFQDRYYYYMPFLAKRWPPVPYQPVLDPIVEPEVGVNDYTVSWSYDFEDISVITYTLQEATNSGFSDAVEYIIPHSGVEYQKEFQDKADGTYYYRVRGHNEYGPGHWSVVRTVSIFTVYRDDFNDSSSGWPHQKGDITDDQGVDHGDWYRRYRNGEYQIYVSETTCWVCYWFLQPDALAPYRPPTDKYCVETQARFENGTWWSNMGMIFGANEANSALYSLCLGRGKDQLGWFLMYKEDYDFPARGCSGPTWKIEGADNEGTSLDGWNKLQVGVDGDKVKVWIGDRYKGQFTMSGLRNMTRVGLIGGLYEINPVDIRFDYFKVLPNQDCR